MSDVILNVPAELLAPIPGPDPAGVSLRYETIYQNIAEARREDDPNLPQGNWQRDLKKSDWHAVTLLCSQVLARQSKDLQIGAWLAEAWLHLEGLEGLTRGLNLLECLCRDYWEGIHPRIEDGDIEYRVGPFEWANDNISLALRLNLTIAEGTSDLVETGLTLAKWEEVLRMENLIRKDARLEKAAASGGKINRSSFMATVSMTPQAFFNALLAQLAQCMQAATGLEQVMREKLGDESPGLTRIKDVLDSIVKVVREFGGVSAPAPEPAGNAKPAPQTGDEGVPERNREEQPMAEQQPTENAAVREEGPSHATVIRSREEAYRRLSDAADYLLRTEPHSPTPYLVMRAVAWGRMPLNELLQELVNSEGDLKQLYTLLGMRPS
jgi:type VI secretion system ImpA family protein